MEEDGPVFVGRSEKEGQGTGKKGSRLKILTFSVLFFLLLFTFYLYYCKSIVLVDEGETNKFYTFRKTVGQFLAEKRIATGICDELRPGKDEQLRDGDTVVIKRAKPIFLARGGDAEEQVWTHAGTVGEFLSEKNISLHSLDPLFPALAKPLSPFDEIRIMRAEEECFIEKKSIPFQTIRINNPRLEPGAVQVLQEGCVGWRENVMELIEQNGTVIYSDLLFSRIVVYPVNCILEYGKDAPLSRGGRCYAFVKELQLEATAYCPGTPGSGCPIDERGAAQCTGFFNDGFTFTGEKAIAGDGSLENPHLVAVDPAVIPLKSLLYIEGYGFARAEDTGSAIKNYCLDLLFNSHQEALLFGRKKVKVYLLKE